MVTGSAAVIARVAHTSVSRETYAPDETCMICTAHLLNNSIKTVMSRCKGIVTLSVVSDNCLEMKKIIEDAILTVWYYLLPSGYKLKQ